MLPEPDATMPVAITIRRAVAADVPRIVALLADDDLGRAREDEQRADSPIDPAYLAAFGAIDGDPNQHLALAILDGQIVGCLQITLIPGLSRTGAWRGQIEGVRVDRGLRGRGVGRRMIAWAIDHCRERGCRIVQLTSDKRRVDARRFYLSLGFTASHEGLKIDL